MHAAAQSSQTVSFLQARLVITQKSAMFYCLCTIAYWDCQGHKVKRQVTMHMLYIVIVTQTRFTKHFKVSADSLLYTLVRSALAHCVMHLQNGRLALLIASSSPTFCASPCRLLESLWRWLLLENTSTGFPWSTIHRLYISCSTCHWALPKPRMIWQCLTSREDWCWFVSLGSCSPLYIWPHWGTLCHQIKLEDVDINPLMV